MKTLFWCAVILLIITRGIMRICDDLPKKRFDARCEALLREVTKHIQAGSVVELPRFSSRKVYNAETGKQELVYTEYAYDGRCRDIFISINGKDIKVMPWRTREKRERW